MISKYYDGLETLINEVQINYQQIKIQINNPILTCYAIQLFQSISTQILVIPASFMYSDLKITILFFIFNLIINLWTCHFLVDIFLLTNKNSLQKLVNELLSKQIGNIFAFINFISNVGFVISNIILLNNLGCKAIEIFILPLNQDLQKFLYRPQSQFWSITLTLFLIYPMTLDKNIVKHQANFFNLIGIIFTFYISFTLIYESFDRTIILNEDKQTIFQGMCQTFPISFMSFNMQTRIEIFFQKIILPNQKQIKQMILDIQMISFVIFTALGISLTQFYNKSQTLLGKYEGNALLADFNNSYLIGLSIIMMCYNSLVMIPTSLVPMKKYLVRKSFKDSEIPMLICCLFCLYTSFMVQNLMDMFNLINLFGTPILCLIMPTALYIKVNKKMRTFDKAALLLIIIILSLLNFYFTFHNLSLRNVRFKNIVKQYV